MCHHSEHDLENDITSRERHVFSRRPRTYIMSALSISILLAPTAILGVTATPAVTHPPQGRTLVNALAADLGTIHPPSTSVPACTDWGIRRTIVIINMTSFFMYLAVPSPLIVHHSYHSAPRRRQLAMAIAGAPAVAVGRVCGALELPASAAWPCVPKALGGGIPI